MHICATAQPITTAQQKSTFNTSQPLTCDCERSAGRAHLRVHLHNGHLQWHFKRSSTALLCTVLVLLNTTSMGADDCEHRAGRAHLSTAAQPITTAQQKSTFNKRQRLSGDREYRAGRAHLRVLSVSDFS